MTLYISIDVEADGPVPGPYSMLSLGAAAFRDGKLLGTWQGNLMTLPDAGTCPETMQWWAGQPEAWDAARIMARPTNVVMRNFVDWTDSFGEKPTAVCYPAGFDWTFVYWYLRLYGYKRSPFGMSAICMKAWAACRLGVEFRRMTKNRMPRSWFRDGSPHTHRAVDDAVEQGWMWVRMSE